MISTDRVFFDTNILVYAYDQVDRRKQRIAQDLLSQAMMKGTGYLSVQILGEFYNATVIRKKKLSPENAQRALQILGGFHVLHIDLDMVCDAVAHHRGFAIGYWDSLVVAAACGAQCSRLLSEDLNAGQHYAGTVATNPFAETA